MTCFLGEYYQLPLATTCKKLTAQLLPEKRAEIKSSSAFGLDQCVAQQ
jgi:hypothetical protein